MLACIQSFQFVGCCQGLNFTASKRGAAGHSWQFSQLKNVKFQSLSLSGSPVDSPEELQMAELRHALVNSQFRHYRLNLAGVTECLCRRSERDPRMLQAATADLVHQLRGTAEGAVLSKECVADVVERRSDLQGVSIRQP